MCLRNFPWVDGRSIESPRAVSKLPAENAFPRMGNVNSGSPKMNVRYMFLELSSSFERTTNSVT